MNEEIAKEVLRWMQAGRESIAEQAPQLAEEVLRYGLWEALLFAVICGGVMAGGLRIAARVAKQNYGDAFLVWFVAGLILTLPAVGFVVAIGQLLQVLVAPRLYLLEKIAGAVQ